MLKERLKFVGAGIISSWGFLAFNWFLFLSTFGWFCSKIFVGLPEGQSDKHRQLLLSESFCYWLFYFIGVLFWLAAPLTIDLKSHGVLIPFALVAIPSYLAAIMLVPTYLTRKYATLKQAPIAFAVLNFAAMYFFGHCAPGFPWPLPGYIWSQDEVTLQTFSLWGIYGQTFLTLLLGSFIGQCYRKNEGILSNIFAFGLISFFYGFGVWRLMNNPTEYTSCKVRCVQASIPQQQKMDRAKREDNLQRYLSLSRNSKSEKFGQPDIIIWPEACVPYLFTEDDLELKNQLTEILSPEGVLITGVVRRDTDTRKVYNSALILSKNSMAFYDKKHLVPFGEYVPFRRFIPKMFSSLSDSIGDFDIGTEPNIHQIKGLKAAFAICYEAIFPGETIENGQNADVIINITNDGWFGHTAELMQHLMITRARAVEEGVPLIRVTNFGISAVFDAFGREIATIDVNKAEVIDTFIPTKAEKTIYKQLFAF